MEIYTNGMIKLDGRDTGFGVRQSKVGTVVYRREITPLSARSLGCEPVDYREIKMPHSRYVLSHPAPLDGRPGAEQFEADLRAMIDGQS